MLNCQICKNFYTPGLAHRVTLRPMGMTMSPAGDVMSRRRAPQSRRAWVFDESRLERYARPGSGRIRGRVFLARGNGVLYGDGVTVSLCPDVVGFFEPSQSDADPRLARYVRRTVTDEHGNFLFKGLPDGRYYVRCLFDALAGRPIPLHGRAEVVNGAETAVMLVRAQR